MLRGNASRRGVYQVCRRAERWALGLKIYIIRAHHIYSHVQAEDQPGARCRGLFTSLAARIRLAPGLKKLNEHMSAPSPSVRHGEAKAEPTGWDAKATTLLEPGRSQKDL